MNYSIGVVKEQDKETRVSLTPDNAKRIVQTLGINVWIETGAGNSAGFSDMDYKNAGAEIATSNEIVNNSDLLLCIHNFDLIAKAEKPVKVICFSNPLYHFNTLLPLLKHNIDMYSLDLIPRTSKAQAMDTLSSMASLSGYKAVIKGAELYNSVLPMFSTAAGTIRPAKVLVLGAGVAGLQAIATAKRLGAIVSAFDVRRAAGEEVRSLGAKFIEVEGAEESAINTGYAIEQSIDYLNKQKELIDKHVSESAIVIATANIPGKKAPLLIERISVEKMKSGSVIIDLAADQGGNCEVTQNGKTIDHNGVLVVGNSFLSRETSHSASNLLSTNYYNFIQHLLEVEKTRKTDDPIVEGCKVIIEGKIVNERVKAQINAFDASIKLDEPMVESCEVSAKGKTVNERAKAQIN
ncbi:MAG: NAD(P) transhydrogenase subunit alpha [Crocinitomicaceae bacterium]